MRLIDAEQFDVLSTYVPKEYESTSYMAGMSYVLEKLDDAKPVGPCACTMPMLTGSTKCCEHCRNNPNQALKKNDYCDVIPTLFLTLPRVCNNCGCVFESNIANYCPSCGVKISKEAIKDNG